MSLSFGDVTFDGDRRALYRGAERLHLSPKAFELLDVLLRCRPRAASKQELYDALWPSTFVEEANLKKLVAEIRMVLGDDHRQPRFLRTVFGFGYAFDGEVVERSAADQTGESDFIFRILCSTQAFDLSAGVNVIGRGSDAAVRINSSKVSRLHAKITISGNEARLEDLGSRNGTWVGGERIGESVALRDGDEILIGSIAATFVAMSRCLTTEAVSAGD